MSAPEIALMKPMVVSATRLTVLTSISELYATKRLRLDRKTGRVIKTDYGRERWFRARQIELGGFGDLCKCLDTLTTRPFALVIRGEPLADADLNRTRRLSVPDDKTGDKAAFAEAARHWFAVDIDKMKQPVTIDPIIEPEDAIEYLIGLLPPLLDDHDRRPQTGPASWHSSGCYAALTLPAGTRPARNVGRCSLTFAARRGSEIGRRAA